MGPGRNLALSLDGAQLAYVTSVSFDGGRVWIHDLADGNRRALTGTEGAERPFWSPDGSMLGYFAEQALHVVPAKGGPSIRLASAPQPSGGTWNAQGVILYNPAGGALFRIPASGGTPIQVTQLTRKGERHESPVFLPNGQHFLFWIIDHSKDDTQYIYKGDLETGQIEQIREGADPAYAASGLLVFRIGADFDIASIFAQRFDPESGTLSGRLLPLLSDLRTPTNNAVLSVTRRTIVFAPKLPGGQDIPILTSRNGGVLDSLAHRERAFTLRFSHDGRRVAFAFKELWVYDLARNIMLAGYVLHQATAYTKNLDI